MLNWKQKVPSAAGISQGAASALSPDGTEREKVPPPGKKDLEQSRGWITMGAETSAPGTSRAGKGGNPMVVTVDPSRCIGCGMCAATAPGVFRVEGHVSVVLAQPSSKSEEGRVFDAANGCPVNAISAKR